MRIVLLLISIFFLTASEGGDRAREANRAYESGDYQRAESLYREILEEQPDSRRILFNFGNALARQGKGEAAAEAFRRFGELAEEPSERAAAEYNLGHVLEETGNTAEALGHFRRAMNLNADDDDAKFNFELLKRRQQDQSDDDQEDDEDDRQDQQPQSGQPPPASDFDQQQDDDADQQPETSPQDQQQQTDDEQPGGQPEITREQLNHAEDIMNALEQIEKDLIKDFKKRQLDPVEPYEKDW